MSVEAAVMPAPGAPLEVRAIPEPDLADGEVLLDTVASEVCGTDVHLHHGRLAGVPYPIIPGHVSVGRIAEARGVREDFFGNAIAPGDLVTFYDVHEVCNECWQCLVAKQPNRCPRRKVYGITYSADEGLLGGWARRILLKRGVKILKVPPPLAADDVIGGGCGLFTGFAAVERSGLRLGEAVLVQGTGPVGLGAVAFARLRGAGQLIAFGAPEQRLRLARDMGADLALSIETDAPAAREAAIRDCTAGRGADVVIEAAGNPAALEEGFRLLRDGGTYVIAGHYTDVGSVTFNPHVDINRKHADVRGQWGTELSHVVRALALLARHRERLPFAGVIGGRYGLDAANEALADVETRRVTKAIIVPA